MNTVNQNQIKEVISVVDYPQETAEAKHCSNCETELLVNNNIHYTSFGLNLCGDCLYS